MAIYSGDCVRCRCSSEYLQNSSEGLLCCDCVTLVGTGQIDGEPEGNYVVDGDYWVESPEDD